jgi:tetratricopeptide (TPR) repeat protein
MRDATSGIPRRMAEGESFVLGLLLLCAIPAAAQTSPPKQPAQQPPAAGQAAAPAKAQNAVPDQPPVSPPVSKEEEDAYRAVIALSNGQEPQIISQSDAFLSKYPSSRYRSSVYSRLVTAYMNSHMKEKMVETAQKAIAENPDNVAVLALVSTVIPRTVQDPKALDADQRLSEAERYARRAIELTPNMTKPDGISEEQFTAIKNETLGLAHFGLGLVYYMRGNSTASVPEFEQASKLDPHPEPLLFYLLGKGDLRLKKFSEAAEAFDHCAKAQWDAQWQARCKSGAEEAKQAAGAPAKP